MKTTYEIKLYNAGKVDLYNSYLIEVPLDSSIIRLERSDIICGDNVYMEIRKKFVISNKLISHAKSFMKGVMDAIQK